MAEARSRSIWGPASHLLALLANLHRDPKKRRRPFRAAEFDPHRPRRRRGRPVTVEGLTRAVLAVGEAKRKGR